MPASQQSTSPFNSAGRGFNIWKYKILLLLLLLLLLKYFNTQNKKTDHHKDQCITNIHPILLTYNYYIKDMYM